MSEVIFYFNSIKVRLRQKQAMRELVHIENFNSIKVRLRRKVIATVFDMNQFQFHKGSIKTRGLFIADKPTLLFQFHKGSIKTQS